MVLNSNTGPILLHFTDIWAFVCQKPLFSIPHYRHPGIGKYEHIIPVLRDTLHWLPVTVRNAYSSRLLLWLCPRYWSCLPQASHLPSLELVISVTPFGWPRRLESRTNASIGQRSFTVATPVVWNALPPELHSQLNSRRQFRSKLKTYLFRQAYNTAWFPWEQFVESVTL